MSEKLETLRLEYPHAEAILSLPHVPSPIWFSSEFDHSNMVATVNDEGRIVVYNDQLVLRCGVIPLISTRLHLTKIGGGFILAETGESRATRIEAERNRVLVIAEQEAADRIQRLSARQRCAELENSKLQIPVRWSSGQKRVLSGLLRNSSGTGENARTVNHVILLEPINETGFTREAGSFLCTATNGSNGRDWTGYRHSRDHGVNCNYVSRITCKQCLRLAARWANSRHWRQAELVTKDSRDDDVAF